jgi:hypothetical protein
MSQPDHLGVPLLRLFVRFLRRRETPTLLGRGLGSTLLRQMPWSRVVLLVCLNKEEWSLIRRRRFQNVSRVASRALTLLLS